MVTGRQLDSEPSAREVISTLLQRYKADRMEPPQQITLNISQYTDPKFIAELHNVINTRLKPEQKAKIDLLHIVPLPDGSFKVNGKSKSTEQLDRELSQRKNKRNKMVKLLDNKKLSPPNSGNDPFKTNGEYVKYAQKKAVEAEKILDKLVKKSKGKPILLNTKELGANVDIELLIQLHYLRENNPKYSQVNLLETKHDNKYQFNGETVSREQLDRKLEYFEFKQEKAVHAEKILNDLVKKSQGKPILLNADSPHNKISIELLEQMNSLKINNPKYSNVNILAPLGRGKYQFNEETLSPGELSRKLKDFAQKSDKVFELKTSSRGSHTLMKAESTLPNNPNPCRYLVRKYEVKQHRADHQQTERVNQQAAMRRAHEQQHTPDSFSRNSSASITQQSLQLYGDVIGTAVESIASEPSAKSNSKQSEGFKNAPGLTKNSCYRPKDQIKLRNISKTA